MPFYCHVNQGIFCKIYMNIELLKTILFNKLILVFVKDF